MAKFFGGGQGAPGPIARYGTETASIMNEGQQRNQIKNVLEIIQKIMETLSTYKKKQLWRRDDPEGNVINLSRYSVTTDQFKVSNKNFNFYRTIQQDIITRKKSILT